MECSGVLTRSFWKTGPHQDAAKWEEEGFVLSEHGQQSLLVVVDERGELRRVEALLEPRQHRAAHPLHDMASARQYMGIDLQADELSLETEVVQDLRVLLRLEHVLTH